MSDNESPKTPPTGRGFAGMDREKQKAISSKGGKAAHEKGTAHEFTPDEARNAGRKGGQTVSQDRNHMAQIGREGGKSRGSVRRQQKAEDIAKQSEPKQKSAHESGEHKAVTDPGSKGPKMEMSGHASGQN